MKSRQMIEQFQTKIRKGKPNAEEKKALEERGVSRTDRKAYKTALIEYRQEVAKKKAEIDANKPLIETDVDILKDIRNLLKEQQTNKETTKK